MTLFYTPPEVESCVLVDSKPVATYKGGYELRLLLVNKQFVDLSVRHNKALILQYSAKSKTVYVRKGSAITQRDVAKMWAEAKNFCNPHLGLGPGSTYAFIYQVLLRYEQLIITMWNGTLLQKEGDELVE